MWCQVLPNVTRKNCKLLGLWTVDCGQETLLRNMASLDPEYVSGGRETEGLEKKLIVVFEKEFGRAIQQVDCPVCYMTC